MASNYISDTFSRMQQSREASMTSWEEYQRAERDRAINRVRQQPEKYTLLNSQRAAAIIPPPPPREIEFVFPIYLFEHDEEGNGDDADPKIIGYCKSLADVEKFIQKLSHLPKFKGLGLRAMDYGANKVKYGFITSDTNIYTYTIVAIAARFDELRL